MSIEVPGCRILVKPDPIIEDETIKSARALGIVIHKSDKDEENEKRKQRVAMDKGTVLQIGPRCSEDYTGGLQVGDHIGFAKFGGKFVQETETSDELLIINDEDVICIFKESK